MSDDINEVARQLGASIDGTCEEVREHLFELLDQEMTRAQLARLSRHVAQCDQCSAAAQAEEHMRDIIRRSCCEEAPSYLRMRVTRITRRKL